MSLLIPNTPEAKAFKSQINQILQEQRQIASKTDLANLYATSVLAYSSAEFWADNIANMKWTIQFNDEPLPEDALTDHPLVSIVYNSNFSATLAKKIRTELFWGYDLIQIERNFYGRPLGLNWLSPLIYQKRATPNEGLIGFSVFPNSSRREPIEQAFIPMEDAWYTNLFSFEDDYDGVSPAEVAFLEASSEASLAMAFSSTFKNGGVPFSIVQPKDNDKGAPPEKTVDRLKRWITTNLRGAAAAGKTWVSSGRWEWIPIQPPWKDMAIEHISPHLQLAVNMAFKTNVEFFITGQTNYAELEGKIRLWEQRRFIPRCRQLANSFTEQFVVPNFGQGWKVIPDFSEIIQDDEKEKIEITSAKMDAGIITIGQAQEAMNEPVDDSLKNYYMVEGVPVPKEVLPNLWKIKFGGNGSMDGSSGMTIDTIGTTETPMLPTASPLNDLETEEKTAPFLEMKTRTENGSLPNIKTWKYGAEQELVRWEKAVTTPPRMDRRFNTFFISKELSDNVALLVDRASGDLPALREIFAKAKSGELEGYSSRARVDMHLSPLVTAEIRMALKNIGLLDNELVSDAYISLVDMGSLDTTADQPFEKRPRDVVKVLEEFEFYEAKTDNWKYEIERGKMTDSLYLVVDSIEISDLSKSLTKTFNQNDITTYKTGYQHRALLATYNKNLTPNVKEALGSVIRFDHVFHSIVFRHNEKRHWLAAFPVPSAIHPALLHAWKSVGTPPADVHPTLIDHVQQMVEAGENREEVVEWAKSFSAAKAISATESRWLKTVTPLFRSFAEGEIDRRRFSQIFRNEIKRFGQIAFRDGLIDGGVKDGVPDADEKNMIDRMIAEQSKHVTAVGDSIKKGNITPEQAAKRPFLWWNKTIFKFYQEGLSSANGNMMLLFTGEDGKESCSTCKQLKGQVHRAKVWKARQLRPRVDTGNFVCGGWYCQHTLEPVSGKAIGRLPRQ